MAKPWEQYQQIVVETYFQVKSGKSTRVHLRRVERQPYLTTLDVECARKMRTAHLVGTRFRIWAKLTDLQGGGEFLYSSWQWPYEVVE